MAGVCSAGGIFDGEHVAVLVRQRDHVQQATSIPTAGADSDCVVHHDSLLGVGVLLWRAGVHVQRNMGACGVWLAEAAQAADTVRRAEERSAKITTKAYCTISGLA